MSVIWDLIKQPQDAKQKSFGVEELLGERRSDRRKSVRSSMYVPLFVYGYTSTEEPFHEETNSLQVNSNGGLVRLDTKVQCGQKLLLMNRMTREEQECFVMSLARRPKHDDLHVGLAFAKAAPGFWQSKK